VGEIEVITGFDRILIDVPDLDQALADYSTLLGAFQGTEAGALLPLRNVGIELRAAPIIDRARIAGLVMVDSATDGTQGSRLVPAPNRGLHLERVGGSPLRLQGPATSLGITAVDHLVLRTADADDCIRVFGDEGLGMRLALDQLVPEWGGRMLFFRTGKMTLEIIHNHKQPPAQDYFWGITYLCPDLDFTSAQLDAAGVSHSPIRNGRKPGTRVATVKSHALGLPTLLIEPAA
jgi:catechol 2,3-dioxygenase-like lactoylglutathione lyase family enzyme